MVLNEIKPHLNDIYWFKRD